MPSLSRIFGWAPTKGEEHVEIPQRPNQAPGPSPPRYIEFKAPQSTDVTTPHSFPAGYEPSSPASSTSSFSPEGGFQSDQFPEPVRRGDPSWVARPRNPFIIFRCEYSREHSKEGKRVRRPPGSQTEKTLSKRAAEAWHQLSAEEKNRFKELADQEKDEHARMHPNYRFRPMKRGNKRPPKRAQGSASPFTPAIVMAPAPQYPENSVPRSPPMQERFPSPPPPPMNMSVKATRRRSASVPSLPMGQHLFTPGFWAAQQSQRSDIKRSRSAMGNRVALPVQTNLPTPYADWMFDLRPSNPSHSSGIHTPEELFNSTQDASGEIPFTDHYSPHGSPGHLSPLTAVTYSLAGWNGEHTGMEPPPPPPSSSSWSSSPVVNVDVHGPQQYTGYHNPNSTESGLSLDTGLIIAPYARGNDSWAVSNPQFSLTMNAAIAVENADPLFASTNSYDAMEQYDLHDYGLGLDERTGESSVWDEEQILALHLDEYFAY